MLRKTRTVAAEERWKVGIFVKCSVAVAFTSDLKSVSLPGKETDSKLANAREIGLYLDTTATGNTGRALFEATKSTYLGKIVHEPCSTQADFEQSPKMRRFWAQYQ